MNNNKQFTTAKAAIDYHIKRKQKHIQFLEGKEILTAKEKIRIREEREFLDAVGQVTESYQKDLNFHLGKLPPQALDLEEAILGALILERHTIEIVERYLLPSHFYSEANRIVYETLLAMRKEKIGIDIRTVTAHLRKSGKAEIVGGGYRIAELTSKVASAVNIEYHARIVIEFAIKRELILLAGEVTEKAYNDSEDCFELLTFTENKLKEIETLNVRK